jgi:hypothetical protein
MVSFLYVYDKRELFAFISPMRASWPTHLILVDLVTLTKWGEEHRI